MTKFRQQHMSVMWHDISREDSDSPAISSPLNERANLVGRVGLELLSVGAGAYRVRAAMNKVSRALNMTINASIGLKAVEYTCFDGPESVTYALSNVTTGVNTNKLNYLEIFCDGFADRAERYSIDDFHKMLDTIDKGRANYSILLLSLASGAACGAFAFLLGGGIIDIICASVAAFFGFFVRKLLLKEHITLFANTSVAVLVSCFVYIMLIKACSFMFGLSYDYQAGYICSMLFVIPGFPLITGGIDLAKLDLRSGIERITYSVLVISVAAITCYFASNLFRFSPGEFSKYDLPLYALWGLRTIASFIGVFGFSMIFNSTFKMAGIAGIIGCIANIIRFLLLDVFTGSPGIAAFFGAFAAGLLATFLRNFNGFPRTTLTVPSIVIMVPGLYMYKGVYYLSSGSYDTGASLLLNAFLIVVALPMGLVFARILTDTNFRKSS